MVCKLANKVEITVRVIHEGCMNPTNYEHVVLRGVNFNPLYTDMIYRIKQDTGYRDDVQVIRVFNKDLELESITTTIAGHQSACNAEEKYGWDIVVKKGNIGDERTEILGVQF